VAPDFKRTPAKIDVVSPALHGASPDYRVVPPYISMFIATAYGGLQAKDSGLEVLNNWIRYYDKLRALPQVVVGSSLPRWFYHRAILQYGILQETDEPYPTTAREYFYLKAMQKMFAADWQIDLDKEGESSGQPKPVAGDFEASARLFDLYSDVVQRLLHAALSVRSAREDEHLAPEHLLWARQLLASADKWRYGEDDVSRADRRALNLLEGGRLLARWAADGARTGTLRSVEVETMRMQALKALLDSMPSIRLHEAQDLLHEGPIRISGSFWEPYRRLAETEILELQASLTNN
jgi:hypothetical protein